jgi:hypothetical protein
MNSNCEVIIWLPGGKESKSCDNPPYKFFGDVNKVLCEHHAKLDGEGK